MNKEIIDQFEKLYKQVEAEYLNAKAENNVKETTMHSYRLKSVKTVLGILKKLDFEIKHGEDLEDYYGVGKSSINRINEILETGKLSELSDKYTLDKAKKSKIDSIQELQKVIGIGESKAKELVVKHKITSVKQLKSAIKKGEIEVSDAIKLGLKYYGRVQENIPRKQITIIEKYLKKVVTKIDPELQITICGSYRRGKKTSGDIDVLLYHPDIKTKDQIKNPASYDTVSYLKLFIKKLKTDKFIIDDMTNKSPSQKYMGFCKYDDYDICRIDIRYVPYNSLGAALTYFTGPVDLNRYMRKKAEDKGLILNEYGLYKQDEDNPKIPGKLIKTTTEEDIFKKLKLKYLTPEEREQFNLNKKVD